MPCFESVATTKRVQVRNRESPVPLSIAAISTSDHVGQRALEQEQPGQATGSIGFAGDYGQLRSRRFEDGRGMDGTCRLMGDFALPGDCRLEYLLTQLRLQNRGKSGDELPVRQSRSASISKFDRHQFRPLLVAAFRSLDRKSHLAIQLQDNVRFTGIEKRCFSSTHQDSSQTAFSGLEVARGDCGTRKSQSIRHLRTVKIKRFSTWT